ncbi:MAG: RNA-binding protein [Calditrichaeota bacterium]|nr:RNA-binding protein [Calditrichota bacterium]
MNIYVGNLSYKLTEEDLNKAFSVYGEVAKATIITDKFTKRSKGFAFVEMVNDNEAKEAIEALNNTELDGRNLKVNEARPREERKPRF